MNEEPTLRRRAKMQSVKMTDVAKLAQVSPSTVSLYLRKPTEVSERMGRRVQSAIDKLGYVPNSVAGGLASAGARVVSIIVPSLRNAVFSGTVSRIERHLSAEGIHTLVGHTEFSDEREEALVRAALSWAPAGIVLTGFRHSDMTRHLLKKNRLPVVEMWEIAPDPIDMAVGFSHVDVGRTIARYLISSERRKIVFVGARLREDSRAAQRMKGYREELSAQGYEPITLGDPRPASTAVGGELLARVLEEVPDADALMCANDTLALGVLFEAQRRGIDVPRDLAVIGFGDMEFSAQCNPALTTVRVETDAIADHVASMLLTRLKGEREAEVATKVVDTGFELIKRDSG